MTDGTITITREAGGYRDRVRAYKVMLDGEHVASIKAGETVTHTAPAGRHEIRMKIDWAGSPTIPFQLTEGGTASFHCEPGGSALTALFALFRPGKYVSLVQR